MHKRGREQEKMMTKREKNNQTGWKREKQQWKMMKKRGKNNEKWWMKNDEP